MVIYSIIILHDHLKQDRKENNTLTAQSKIFHFKRMGKNTIIYGVGNILSRAAAFLLIPLYTRALSVSDYGLLATLITTIQIMVIFMSTGMRTGFLRFAKEYEDEGRLSILIGSTIFINIAGGIIVSILALTLLPPLFRNILHVQNVFNYLLLVCLAATFQSVSLHMMTYYRAKHEPIKFLIAGVSTSVLLIIATYILIMVFNFGVQGAMIAQIIAYGLIFILITLHVLLKIGLNISMDSVKKLGRFGVPLIFAMSGDLVTFASAIYFLSYFRSLEEVAIYSIANKIAYITNMILILPFQLAYEPFVYGNINSPNIKQVISKILTYLMVSFSLLAFFLVFIFRDLLAAVTTEAYSAAYLLIFLVLPGVAFRGVYYIGESLLNIAKKTYIAGTTVTTFSILSLILNYFLIRQWGTYGLIGVFYFNSIGTSVFILWRGIKEFPIHLEIKRLIVISTFMVVLLILTFYLNQFSNLIFYSLTPLLAIVVMVVFYHLNFFNENEKIFINKILSQIKLKFA